MIINLLIWSLLFIIFYEILPESLCRLNGDELKHFAGTVHCNGVAEISILLISVITLVFLILKFDKNKDLMALLSQTPPSNLLKYTALISTTITCISAFFLWMKTGFTVIPDSSSRATLVVLYHSIFGSPLVSPFLYLSIITSTYLYVVHDRKLLWVICSVSIIFGCYITMSRGFILSAILPYLITQRPSKFIRFVPILLLLFFLRDILNGSFFSYIEAESDVFSTSIDAFGEFTNTYFGRRYFIDAKLNAEYFTYIIENLVKISGAYYFFLPLVKTFAAFGLEIPNSTLNLNNLIQNNLGLTGFAGSFISDFVIFFPFSIIIIAFGWLVTSISVKKMNDIEEVLFLLIAAMLLPNAFRWSATGYIAMLTGVSITYIIFKEIIRALKKFNAYARTA